MTAISKVIYVSEITYYASRVIQVNNNGIVTIVMWIGTECGNLIYE